MVLLTPRHAPPTTPAQLAPLARRELVAGSLPAPLTRFIGRESEIATVTDLLNDPTVRLVTLTGSGGVGKTRLALQTAEAVKENYADGQIFVPLASISDPALISPAIAQSIGIRETMDVPAADRLVDVIRDRQILAILDNFEHIIEAAPMVVSLLTSCPHLTVLATSRSPLRVSGEHVVEVLPLTLPADGAGVSPADGMKTDAVRLFVARANAVRHDFALTDENASEVSEIVHRVEGLPLAIELAAARLAHLPLEGILDRLEPRLPLLTGGERDLPERQQTMAATIAWSYELLTPDQQQLFRQLAIFVDGFTLEAASAVCNQPESSDVDVLDGVASLVAMSLIRPVVDAPGPPRYVMLEMVREYGLNILRESGAHDRVRTLHANWCVKFAERADPAIWGGPNHAYWLDRLEIELPNLRAALSWLDTSRDEASLLRLAAALGGLWSFRSYRVEGQAWLTKALASKDESVPSARAMALIKLAILNRALGNMDVEDLVLEGLAIRRRLDDRRAVGRSLNLLASVLLGQGATDRAQAVLQEAEQFLTELNDLHGLGTLRLLQAEVASHNGDLLPTRRLLQVAYEFFEQDRSAIGMAQVRLTLGWMHADRKDFQQAAHCFAESLQLWSEFRNKEFLVDAMIASAYLAANMSRPRETSRFLGFAQAHSESLGYCISPWKRERFNQGRKVAVKTLGEEAFMSELQAGRVLSIAQTIEEACTMLDFLKDECSPGSPSGVLKEAAFSSPGALTPRQGEILRHVAAGRTNRQIADRLHVSDRTVENHVHHILAKLELPSRSAAAGYAIRNGLD